MLADYKHIKAYFAHHRETQTNGVAVKKHWPYTGPSSVLNFLAKKLKPRVRHITHLRGIGASLPDELISWRAVKVNCSPWTAVLVGTKEGL